MKIENINAMRWLKKQEKEYPFLKELRFITNMALKKAYLQGRHDAHNKKKVST